VYRTLEADRIVETADLLAARVGERFPGSGLSKVAAEVATLARQAQERCAEIRRPHRSLRVLIGILLLSGVAALSVVVANVQWTGEAWQVQNFLGGVNDLLGSIVFFGAAIVFLVTLETRWKREKAVAAVGELRAVAHIIDMHQLTKDPEPILRTGPPTAHSPKRTMTPFELSRYFDYCSELLALLSKVATLYVQAFPDAGALDAVDDLEDLCAGLSRKIWQKIMVLDRFAGDGPTLGSPPNGGAP
jgi:hypothetical protein